MGTLPKSYGIPASRGTTMGSAPLAAIVRSPVLRPEAVGWKATEMTQRLFSVSPAGSWLGQEVPATTKSPCVSALTPASVTSPPFVMGISMGELVWPIAT